MMPANTIARSLEIGLRVVGVWPGASHAIISRLFWTATMLAAQIFQYRHVVVHLNSEDLSRLMDGLSATLSYSLLFVKLIVFWTKQRYVFTDCVFRICVEITNIEFRVHAFVSQREFFTSIKKNYHSNICMFRKNFFLVTRNKLFMNNAFRRACHFIAIIIPGKSIAINNDDPDICARTFCRARPRHHLSPHTDSFLITVIEGEGSRGAPQDRFFLEYSTTWWRASRRIGKSAGTPATPCAA